MTDKLTTEKDVAKAERDLSNLENQREALFHRAGQLSKQREAVAFAALTGDAKSKAALQEVNLEDASCNADIRSVEAALAVARSNLIAAQAAAAGAADRDSALALRQALTEWKERAANVDAAFEDLHNDLEAMANLLNKMHRLGSSFPTHEQFNVLGLLSLKTALMGTPIWSREFDHLAPHQRRSFKQLIDGWADTIESGIAQRLGSEKEAA